MSNAEELELDAILVDAQAALIGWLRERNRDDRERAVNDRRRLMRRLRDADEDPKELIRMLLRETLEAAGGTVVDHAYAEAGP